MSTVGLVGSVGHVYSRCGVMRTSLLPFDELVAWSDGLSAATADGDSLVDAVENDTNLLRQRLNQLWQRPEVREAVLVASPDFARELSEWSASPNSERGQKLERTFVRYFSRMAMRATPFGLFSGVSAVAPGAKTNLVLPERASYLRRSRVDSGLLCSVVRSLSQQAEVLHELRVHPNRSLYELGGNLRYTAVKQQGDRRAHHLRQLEHDGVIGGVLEAAKDGATLAELAEALVHRTVETQDPWTQDEARRYVDELWRQGVLMHALEPPVTGRDGLVMLLDAIAPLKSARLVHRTLSEVSARLSDLDRGGVGAPWRDYEELITLLRSLEPEASAEAPTMNDARRHWLQVDLAKPTPGGMIGASVLAAVDRGVEALRRITPEAPTSPLDDFRQRFSARYEGREVPLLEALDEELGVGLNGPGNERVPSLLDGLIFPPRPGVPQVDWGRRERHLLALLCSAERTGATNIILTEHDLEQMQANAPQTLPDARHVVFSVAAANQESVDRGDFEVWLLDLMGPSGAAVAGRFCWLLPELEAGVREQLRAEEALRPDAAFVEIAHLPEGRAGNIVSRPALRELEVPISTTSGVPESRQVPLGDIMLSVVDDRLVLRSRKLNRELLPRLTNAHNFELGFTVYRFLCLMQESAHVSWSWGSLESAPFLPRVTFGNVVFSLARWVLTKEDIAVLRNAGHGFRQATDARRLAEVRAQVFSAARELQERLRLPRRVLLVDGDNTLGVDFDNVLSVDSFVQLVRSRDSVELREIWPEPDRLVTRGPEGRFFHELIASCVRAEPSTQREARAPVSARASVARRLIPGSDCAYFKLYTGATTCDAILTDSIRPFTSSLVAEGTVSHWFFTRFADPDCHLRLRFFGAHTTLNRRVVPALQELASSLERRGLVWRVQVDTYEREVERYGGDANLLLAEQLFCLDSTRVLEAMHRVEQSRLPQVRWLLTLRGMDTLLAGLGLAVEDRLRIVSKARDAFGEEVNAGPALYQQLGDRFRFHKAEISASLGDGGNLSWKAALVPMTAACPRLSELGTQLGVASEGSRRPPDGLFTSYLHMHANRLLSADVRKQELVMYDFLRRHYQALLAVRRTDAGRG